MRRLATHALTLFALAGLIGWSPLPPEQALAHAKIRCGPPDVSPRRLQPTTPQVDGGPSESADPEGSEREVQPPGREDPDQFYRKPPREPRHHRHIYA